MYEQVELPAVCLGLDIDMKGKTPFRDSLNKKRTWKPQKNLKKPFKNMTVKNWFRRVKKTSWSCSTSSNGNFNISRNLSLEKYASRLVLIYISRGFMFAVMEIFTRNKFQCFYARVWNVFQQDEPSRGCKAWAESGKRGERILHDFSSRFQFQSGISWFPYFICTFIWNTAQKWNGNLCECVHHHQMKFIYGNQE